MSSTKFLLAVLSVFYWIAFFSAGFLAHVWWKSWIAYSIGTLFLFGFIALVNSIAKKP